MHTCTSHRSEHSYAHYTTFFCLFSCNQVEIQKTHLNFHLIAVEQAEKGSSNALSVIKASIFKVGHESDMISGFTNGSSILLIIRSLICQFSKFNFLNNFWLPNDSENFYIIEKPMLLFLDCIDYFKMIIL